MCAIFVELNDFWDHSPQLLMIRLHYIFQIADTSYDEWIAAMENLSTERQASPSFFS